MHVPPVKFTYVSSGANSVELYYSDPKRLKEFNHKSFLILESIIKSKEKQ
jgi:hypothetical protein